MLLFQAALARRRQPAAEVMSYVDLLTGRDSLARAAGPGCLIRLESPGQDFEVEKQLIALGATVPEEKYHHAASLDPVAASALKPDKGRILYPRQWYRGFCAFLEELERQVADRRDVGWMNAPADAIRMYDKPWCQRAFAGAGLPVPPYLGSPCCFDELVERLRDRKRQRVFVKLATGSSASGTVALALHEAKILAITTVEMVQQDGAWALYNSRRIRTYEGHHEIRVLIDLLCREGVHVEEWLPKETLGEAVFDLRVVVIGGRAWHTVARTSRSPLTNLHLLNRRGDVEAARARVGSERWESALATCAAAARLFPNSWYAGVDILFQARSRRHALLEINAFGDLLRSDRKRSRS